MIDELTDWGLAPPVIVADAGYGDNGLFRTALSTRGLPYIVQVKAATSMHTQDAAFGSPEYSGRGRPKSPATRPHLSGRRCWHNPFRQGSTSRCPGARVVKGR